MKLVILAGGEGKRLYPLTKDIPKPMVQIAGKPVLQHNIEWARDQSIEDIVICSGYKHEVIENYFGDGSKFGVRIIHSVEDKPLGTGGALRLVHDKLMYEEIIVLNGDVLCRMDFQKLLTYHKKTKADATIVVHDNNHPEDSDLVEFDADGKLEKFWLRPHQAIPPIKKSIAGVYVLHWFAREWIPKGEYSLEKQLLPYLYSMDYLIYCYDTENYLKDMGTFERLKEIESDFSKF